MKDIRKWKISENMKYIPHSLVSWLASSFSWMILTFTWGIIICHHENSNICQHPTACVQFANSMWKFVKFMCFQHDTLSPSYRLKCHHIYCCSFPSRKQVCIDYFVSRETTVSLTPASSLPRHYNVT